MGRGSEGGRRTASYHVTDFCCCCYVFCFRYDHGRFGNLFHYGSTDPPEYDLSRVRVPTSLYVGAADSFGTPDDADLLASRLGADAKSVQVVGGPDWGHLHFAFSKDAGRVVLDSIVDSMLETDRGLRMATARDARSS